MGRPKNPPIVDFGFAPLEVVNEFNNKFKTALLADALSSLLQRQDDIKGLYPFKPSSNLVSWLVQTSENESPLQLYKALDKLDGFVAKHRLDSRSAALELLLYYEAGEPFDNNTDIQVTIEYNSTVLESRGDDEDKDGQDIANISAACIGKRKRKYTKKADFWLNGGRKRRNSPEDCLCTFCHKVFSCKAQRVMHERTHTGEKPFVCEICDDAFVQKGALVLHQLTHQEKQFACEHCEMLFTTKRGLEDHKRNHTGERPYKCRFCDRSYVRRTNLAEHETLHTGEMRYKCRYCGRPFRKYCSKAKHEKIHLEDKQHECGVCGHSFVQKYNLLVHMRRKHSKVQESFGLEPKACGDGLELCDQGNVEVVNECTENTGKNNLLGSLAYCDSDDQK